MPWIAGILFSDAAATNIEETGLDPTVDLEALFVGRFSEASLLAYCLNGADPDREQGWRDYVKTLVDELGAKTR